MSAHYDRVADGNIVGARFVSLSTTVEGRVLQSTDGAASVGDPIWGIADAGTRTVPYGALDDGFVAIQGENCKIKGPMDNDILLELGGTVTRGDKLKSDSSGRGITTTTSGDNIGAKALDSGVLGALIPVQCIPDTKY